MRQPTMEPPFADMRAVQAMNLRVKEGINPQIASPHDLWGRPAPYPKLWALIGEFLGLEHEGRLLAFTIIFIFLYLISCAWTIYRYPCVYSLAFPFSFSSLLLLERGNNDLVIHAILFVCLVFIPKFAGFGILVSSMLKIYPIFAAASLYLKPKTTLFICFLGIVYFILNIQEITAIRRLVWEGGIWSYGASSLALAVQYKLKTMFQLVVHIPTSSVLVLLAVLLMGCSFLIQRRHQLFESNATNLEKRLFLAGLGIFCGTFLVSSNYDYKLCFLLFCLPYLIKIQNSKVSHFILIILMIAINGGLIHMNVADVANLLGKVCLFGLLGGMGLTLLLYEWGLLRRDSHPAAQKKCL